MDNKYSFNLTKYGWVVVINLSIVSFLADFIYEGSRSILGQYFLLLNIPVFYLGLVAGFSEFVGYSVRYFIGYFVDKFKQARFLIIYLGYFLNLITVPLLYFANNYYFVWFLIFLERFGKGLRIPPRDSVFFIVSNKCSIESNKIFGIHHLMDQLGAFIGPLVLSFIFFYFNFKDIYHYKLAFLILGIPILLVFLHLFLANIYFDKITNDEIKSNNKKIKRDTEIKIKDKLDSEKIKFGPKLNHFYIMVIFSMIVAFGYIDFPVILYYFKGNFNFDYLGIILYSIAMISSALGGFISSIFFRRYPAVVIIFSLFLVIFYPILLFFIRDLVIFIISSVFWGWALGSLETIFKIIVSLKSEEESIGRRFGVFHTFFGLSWFIGSLSLALIYQKLGFNFMLLFSFFIQLISILFFFLFKKQILFYERN